MKKLTAENVYQTFISCLFKDGESTDNAILVSGISRKIGFHPDRLLTVKDEVKGYLSQLPKEFGEEYGGWSFLNGCVNANEELWGEHENAEQLFMMGLALNLVICPFPKEMWWVLPGSVPYYMIVNE